MGYHNTRCEVLNASYEPLSIVSGRRALVLVLRGKATVLAEHPTHRMRSEKADRKVPTQILLREMKKIAPHKPVQLTQRNLFTRDMYYCQYCLRHHRDLNLEAGERLTRDHVIPQSLGGLDVWTNVVTACNKCNHRKANKRLQDSGLTLHSKPRVPLRTEIWGKRGAKMTHFEINPEPTLD